MSFFLDPRLAGLKPYTPGEQPGARRVVKLNTNENPYPLPRAAVEAARQQAGLLNLYPDPALEALLAQMAETFGLPRECLTAGNGSDELLAFCFQGLCPKGAAFADITYGFYPVFAALYGVKATVVPLRHDFVLAVEDYQDVAGTVFIANPNAPTGLALGRAQVARLLRQNPRRLVVVDEAYVDFGAESALPLLAEYGNLLVVNTFSKSRSMAGARLGWAAGSAELISDLERIRNSFNPYNLNRMTMAAGAAVLREAEWFEECRFKIKKTRARTLVRLRQMGFACTNSLANFIFTSHPAVPAGQLYEDLRQRGILVRWFDRPRIGNHLRITVGTDAEMDALLAALEEILAASPAAVPMPGTQQEESE